MSGGEMTDTFNIQLIDHTCQHMYRNGKQCGLERRDPSKVHDSLVFVRTGEKAPDMHLFVPSIAHDLENKIKELRRLIVQAYPAVAVANGRGAGRGLSRGTWTGWMIHVQCLKLTPHDEEQQYAADGRCTRRYPLNRIDMCGETREGHEGKESVLPSSHRFRVPEKRATSNDNG